jgi:flagellar hook-associated protein 3 FlgL
MRISTNTFFESGTARLSDLQSGLMRTQQQIATGRRMLTPADDPVAASRALEITQSQSTNLQYATNRQNVKDSLSLEEGTLQSITLLLQDVQNAVVNAGNGTLDNTQRRFIATDLQGRFQELLGLANSRDATGNYMFAGYQAMSQPFAQSATGASYLGDQGERLLQVGPARQMALSNSGDAIFEKNKTGNGAFVTAAASTVVSNVITPSNTGSGIISSGSVTNSTALTGHTYEVVFSAGGATYSVFDTTLDPTKAGTPLQTGAYVSGQSIAFDGMQVDIKGSPANGDSFTIEPSANQSLFTTLKDLIDVLNAPATGAVGQANLANGLSTASNNLSHAMDNILSVRASIGSRLNEIDALDSAGSDRDLQYAETLANLQELDYTKAISQLTQQQLTLSAAQQSFVKISGMSLFNYL